MDRELDGALLRQPIGAGEATIVRQFRQILLWPLQLMPIREGEQIQEHWEVLQRGGAESAWRELTDEFTGDPAPFQEATTASS